MKIITVFHQEILSWKKVRNWNAQKGREGGKELKRPEGPGGCKELKRPEGPGGGKGLEILRISEEPGVPPKLDQV